MKTLVGRLGGLEFLEFVTDRLERALDAGEVKSTGRRSPLHLAGIQRAGQILRHLAEQAWLAALLALLDLVPVAEHLLRGARLHLAEHVRVSADQLLGAVLRDLSEVAGAALLEQQREEVDLEEDVTELVEQLGVVTAKRRVGELVGLLDGVRDDRALVLLAIPRALACAAAG